MKQKSVLYLMLDLTLAFALSACTNAEQKAHTAYPESASVSEVFEAAGSEPLSSEPASGTNSASVSETTTEPAANSESMSSPERITPFTSDTAFEFLKETEKFGDNIIATISEYEPEENYYYLVAADANLRKNGESGTIGSYHIYVDGTILDTYPDEPFTMSAAFDLLKNAQGFNDDIVVETSTYDPDKKYQELIVASKELKENGGSGTVGIYQVYENGTIIDTYAD